jgi:DNA-binding transcriptional ArsR family regulator
MSSPEVEGSDLQSIADIDRIVHEPARLMILTVLSIVESADFLYLMRQTGLTRGNLSSHMSKLEAAGYLEIEKEFVGKVPHTLLRLTERGREALVVYRRSMIQVLGHLAE